MAITAWRQRSVREMKEVGDLMEIWVGKHGAKWRQIWQSMSSAKKRRNGSEKRGGRKRRKRKHVAAWRISGGGARWRISGSIWRSTAYEKRNDAYVVISGMWRGSNGVA